MSQSLSLKSTKGDSWYEFRSSSPESDLVMRLDPSTLFPRSSEVITHSADSVIRRTTEILKATPHPKPGELMIGDFNSLPVTLRGLPWGTFTSVNLVTLGATGRGQQFSLKLTVVGRESISAGGKTYDCWHVQIGLGGFLGSLMGKSSYWFSRECPPFSGEIREPLRRSRLTSSKMGAAGLQRTRLLIATALFGVEQALIRFPEASGPTRRRQAPLRSTFWRLRVFSLYLSRVRRQSEKNTILLASGSHDSNAIGGDHDLATG